MQHIISHHLILHVFIPLFHFAVPDFPYYILPYPYNSFIHNLMSSFHKSKFSIFGFEYSYVHSIFNAYICPYFHSPYFTISFSHVFIPPCFHSQVATLNANLDEMTLSMEGLEGERDFYFQKLRDIEVLCQENEDNPLVKPILEVMYATQVSVCVCVGRERERVCVCVCVCV